MDHLIKINVFVDSIDITPTEYFAAKHLVDVLKYAFTFRNPWQGKIFESHNFDVRFQGDIQIHRHEFVSEERKR